MPPADPPQGRLLLLAPTGRDAPMVCAVLERAGIESVPCSDIDSFCAGILQADGAIIAEEALVERGVKLITAALSRQPLWSDFPLIVLGAPNSSSAVGLFEQLSSVANLTLVERPAHPFTLVTVARAVLRARHRQHLTRDHLSELVDAREEIAKQRDERSALLESERSARAEAERVGRMKDEFLSTLSHELRTPLNAIAGWAHLLQLGALSPEEQSTAVETICRNTRAQAELIEDLLDMSRIVSGKARLDLQNVDLVALIAGAVESMRPMAQAKEITLTKELGPPADPVLVDPARLQQIVWNLVNNAVKFTPHGGQVRVVITRSESSVQISVIDSGIGIASEFLPHVFDRFRQADASSTRRHGGVGLGLAIVKHLVEMHAGSVQAASPGEGRGTVFTVYLPLAPQPTQITSRRQPAPDPIESPGLDPTALMGVTVLVLDDDTDGREMIKRMLEESHATALTADSVEAAMAILNGADVDILLSDIGMPGRDGYDLIKTIRASDSPRLQRLPAAALTAFARPEDRKRALQAGYDSHISKPVAPAELLAVVDTLRKKSTTPIAR